MFDFQIDRVCAFISAKGARSVALQMPEGLKRYAPWICDQVRSRAGARCIIIGGPCYGACDLRTDFHRHAEVLVHFGHAPIPSLIESDKVLYVEVPMDFDIVPSLERIVHALPERIGLVTTVQHVHLLPKAKDYLISQGKEVHIGKGDGRIAHGGQVLGCNVSSARAIMDKVEGFLFIGGGHFHPLAISLDTDRSVIVLDPQTGQVDNMDELKDKVLRQRHAAIARSHDARRFGVLVSSKVGQDRYALALDIVKRLGDREKEGYIIVLEEITPEQLLPYDFDAFVSTACPRLAIDDQMRYPKPMLTPVELEILLGTRRWEDYRLDAIEG